jgi:hypothetical protein
MAQEIDIKRLNEIQKDSTEQRTKQKNKITNNNTQEDKYKNSIKAGIILKIFYL